MAGPGEKDGALWVVAVPCPGRGRAMSLTGGQSALLEGLYVARGCWLLGAVPASQLHVKHQMVCFVCL